MRKVIPLFAGLIFATVLARYRLLRFYPLIKPWPMLMIGVVSFTYSSGWSLLQTGWAWGLAGDILLSAPGAGIVPGLTCFLAGHLFYLVHFSGQLTEVNYGTLMYPGLLFFAGGSLLLMHLWPGIRHRRILKISVPVYMLISLALITVNFARFLMHMADLTVIMAMTGTFLFVLSDALLGYEKFVAALPWLQAVLLPVYYAGQFGIVLSPLAGSFL